MPSLEGVSLPFGDSNFARGASTSTRVITLLGVIGNAFSLFFFISFVLDFAHSVWLPRKIVDLSVAKKKIYIGVDLLRGLVLNLSYLFKLLSGFS